MMITARELKHMSNVDIGRAMKFNNNSYKTKSLLRQEELNEEWCQLAYTLMDRRNRV